MSFHGNVIGGKKGASICADLTVFQFYFLKWTPSVFMVINYNHFLR